MCMGVVCLVLPLQWRTCDVENDMASDMVNCWERGLEPAYPSPPGGRASRLLLTRSSLTRPSTNTNEKKRLFKFQMKELEGKSSRPHVS